MCKDKCQGICTKQKQNSKNIGPDSRKHVCPMLELDNLVKLAKDFGLEDFGHMSQVIHLDAQTNTIQIDHFTV